jgi:hypothetical protein
MQLAIAGVWPNTVGLLLLLVQALSTCLHALLLLLLVQVLSSY